MPAGPIGACWAPGTWSDTTWGVGTWGDGSVIPTPPAPDVNTGTFRRRPEDEEPFVRFIPEIHGSFVFGVGPFTATLFGTAEPADMKGRVRMSGPRYDGSAKGTMQPADMRGGQIVLAVRPEFTLIARAQPKKPEDN